MITHPPSGATFRTSRSSAFIISLNSSMPLSKVLLNDSSSRRIVSSIAFCFERTSGKTSPIVRATTSTSWKRSEERRVGKECIAVCRCRWWRAHLKRSHLRRAAQARLRPLRQPRAVGEPLHRAIGLRGERVLRDHLRPGRFFFFKQKTAYDIPLCDWSSDVCSSDLLSANNLLPRRHSQVVGYIIRPCILS